MRDFRYILYTEELDLGGVRSGRSKKRLVPVVELALQKKRQAKQPVVKIQKPESAVAVMLLISRYFYVTREEVMSRKHLEGFSTETSLYLNISIFSHVALPGLFEVDIDILKKVLVFINRIHYL